MNRSVLTKRSVSVILVALLTLSVVSFPVSAASAAVTADGGEASLNSQETFAVSLGSDRTAQIGDTLRLEPEVTGESGAVRYDWNYDVDGAYPREFDDESALSLGTMIAPGNYTVTVTATDESGRSVTDTVNVTVVSEFGETEQVQSGQTLSGDDIDGVYAIEAEKGEAIGMVSGGGMRQAVLYDRNAQPIRTITAGPDTVLRGTTAEYSGQYFLAITSESDTYAELRGYTRSQEASEPNQGRSDATQISPDTSTTGILTKSDGADWYAVETDEGSLNVSAELSVDALYQGDLELQIYTADGRPIGEVKPFSGGTTTNQTYASGAGGMFEAQQSARITDAGTYYVRVARPETDREYTVGFTEYNLTVDGTEITDEATSTPRSTATATSTPTSTSTPTETATTTETVVTESRAAATESVETTTSTPTPTVTSTTTRTNTPSESAAATTEANTVADASTPEPTQTEANTVADSSTPEPTQTETPAQTRTSAPSESPTTTAAEDTATTSANATTDSVTATATAEAETGTATASPDGEPNVVSKFYQDLKFTIQSYLWNLF